MDDNNDARLKRVQYPVTQIGAIIGGLVVLSGTIVILTSTKELPEPAVETSLSSPKRFHYFFATDGVLEERASMEESSSPYFWLNSGGNLIIEDGVGKTVQDELDPVNKWRLAYARNNPKDTEEGFHPQNIFRLITKDTWNNFEQTVRFNINSLNEAESPNRDAWSGVLLMSRYQDGDNLYYAGVRVDGIAVIKKKYDGIYYTLAAAPAFPSDRPYDREMNPSLIPEKKWMGLKSIIRTEGTENVKIDLWIDRTNDGSWEQLLSANDNDRSGAQGETVIEGPAYAGIRTDYLDVFFDDYELTEWE
jgi:hypothetical protein